MTEIELLAVVRAVHIASTVAVAGASAFRLFVLPRSPSPLEDVNDGDTPETVAARWTAAWCSVALTIAAASWLGWLALTAASMSGAPMSQVFDGDVLGIVLSRTTFGHVWIARSACMLVLAGILVAARRRDRQGASHANPHAAGVALLLLLTIAGTGHAIAGESSERVTRVAVDVLHLLGAGAWLGALVPLLFVLGRATATSPAWRELAIGAVRRFSVLGVVAVLVLLGSGLLNAAWLVGSWAALGDTPYGRLVAVKVACFVLIVSIAAVNRLHWTPRLDPRDSPHRALRGLRRNVILELGLGAIVLAVVGLLGVTPPSSHEHGGEAHAMLGIHGRESQRLQSVSGSGIGVLRIEEGCRLSTPQGDAAVQLTTYSSEMNSPWPSLIAALSGERPRVPSTWPVREIHRLCDIRATKSGVEGQAQQERRAPLRSAGQSPVAGTSGIH